MKKSIPFLIIFALPFFTNCHGVKINSPELKSIISITHNGRTEEFSDNYTYYLYSEQFDIRFKELVEDQAISIFVHYSPENLNSLAFPVKTIDTILFNPGCAMAENPLDVNKGYTLRVSDKYGFHYVSSDRRLNTETEAVIPVTSISDPTGCFTNDLYLSIFVDFNKNNTIEENEYATISLHFPLSGISSDLDFSENKRGYFTSPGHSLLKEKYKYTGKDFKIYKITSHDDFIKAAGIENTNLVNITLEQIALHRFDDKNLTDECAYLCFIPEGFNQTGNTFRLKGSKTIYLEVTPDSPENDRAVNIRYFSQSINAPEAKVSFYSNGTLITPEIIKF